MTKAAEQGSANCREITCRSPGEVLKVPKKRSFFGAKIRVLQKLPSLQKNQYLVFTP